MAQLTVFAVYPGSGARPYIDTNAQSAYQVTSFTCSLELSDLPLPENLVRHLGKKITPGSVACAIKTTATRQDKSALGSIVDSVRVPPSRKLGVFGSHYGLGGSLYAHSVVVQMLILAVFAGIYAFFSGWRDDVRRLVAALKRNPVILFIPMMAKSVGTLLGMAASLLSIHSTGYAYPIFSSVVHAPIYEEIFFRFMLFTWISRYSNALFSGIFVSAIFASTHDYPLTGTLSVFASALAFQWIYVKYRSISACILAHAISNAVILAGGIASGRL